jgi:hypothetical protein
MHPKHMIQLTANTFARHGRHGDQDGQLSRYAGRRDDQLEFMKHIVDVVRQLPDSFPPAAELYLVRDYLVP